MIVTRGVEYLSEDSTASVAEAADRPTSDAKTLTPKFWAIVVWSLYLVSFLSFINGAFWFGSVFGLIIAYIKREELDETLFESHATSAIWTFWLYVGGCFFGMVIFLLLSDKIVLGIDILLGVWKLLRSLRGLYFAINSRDIADPTSWFL
ncbi:hypothetical protein PY365_29190 [Roseiarcaceae bacterium H3SJ34-1]|uniref:hypothetical protein n=1 Tax=Terripilifer ovatus TaxID=3032367 RepID=UPI003AB94F60|nr:hypothetical protein [Roseiarcaceae bacterium H3SJ34-1]